VPEVCGAFAMLSPTGTFSRGHRASGPA
jgi:hypothetical protein